MAQSPFGRPGGKIFFAHEDAPSENVSSSSVRVNFSEPGTSPSGFHSSSPLPYAFSSLSRHGSSPYTRSVFSSSRPPPPQRAAASGVMDPVDAAGEMLKYAATQWELTAAQSEALVVALQVRMSLRLWCFAVIRHQRLFLSSLYAILDMGRERVYAWPEGQAGRGGGLRHSGEGGPNLVPVVLLLFSPYTRAAGGHPSSKEASLCRRFTYSPGCERAHYLQSLCCQS